MLMLRAKTCFKATINIFASVCENNNRHCHHHVLLLISSFGSCIWFWLVNNQLFTLVFMNNTLFFILHIVPPL